MARPRERKHRLVEDVRCVVEELAQTRALVDFLLGHVKRLSDACIASDDVRTRCCGFDYRLAIVKRFEEAPSWASDRALAQGIHERPPRVDPTPT